MSASTRSRRSARVAKPESDVGPYMKALDHPLKKEIEAARKIILSARADIAEAVKWQAPSFRTSDYFATFNVRATDQVQIVFHTGAKAKGRLMQGKVDDPKALLRWLAKDRALASLGAGAAFRSNRAALADLTRAWIAEL